MGRVIWARAGPVRPERAGMRTRSPVDGAEWKAARADVAAAADDVASDCDSSSPLAGVLRPDEGADASDGASDCDPSEADPALSSSLASLVFASDFFTALPLPFLLLDVIFLFSGAAGAFLNRLQPARQRRVRKKRTVLIVLVVAGRQGLARRIF